ncbi:MAG: hypothetical protein AAB263_13515 [Planctomycetota bacterium]
MEYNEPKPSWIPQDNGSCTETIHTLDNLMILINARFILGGRPLDEVIGEFYHIICRDVSPYENHGDYNHDGMIKVIIRLHGNTQDAKEIIGKIGDPFWQHEWKTKRGEMERSRDCLDVIIDSRNELTKMKELFWLNVYCEEKETLKPPH